MEGKESNEEIAKQRSLVITKVWLLKNALVY